MANIRNPFRTPASPGWQSLFVAAASLLPLPARCASDGIMLDGFDVDLALAWFVSSTGSDANPGTAARPFATIKTAIAQAASDSTRKNVVVAAGIYGESVALASGVGVYGEYTPGSFVRAAGNFTVITGVSTSGINDRAVVAAGIGSATVFDRFVVFGPFNAKPGGNSYAIYVNGAGSNLQITNNIVFAGNGGPGSNGGDGGVGATGVAGGGRSADLAVADAGYDAFAATGTGECNVTNNRQIPNSGKLTCGATAVDGGGGGGNQCPVKSACTAGNGSGCTAFAWNEFSALDGAGGKAGGTNGGNAGAGAFGGDDFVLYNATAIPTLICYSPTDTDGDGNNTAGIDGSDGGGGSNGGAGSGCGNPAGTVSGGDWFSGIASAGGNAGNGGGGGGGGAGAGARCNAASPSQCPGGHDNLGGHGGGGGSGGCGGSGGAAGGSGGGAFGIFIVFSATAPVVTGNRIVGGAGGRGGRGGNGGRGGSGGSGGLGGSSGVPALYCSDSGGSGGHGGTGGIGGGGGGGCGGASFGIYASGIGSPNYCQGAAANLIENGAAGAAGSGGLSLGNSGSDGQNGTLAACSFH